jgi:hypothetical protein
MQRKAIVALVALGMVATGCTRGEVEEPRPAPPPPDTVAAEPAGEPVDVAPLPADTARADTVAAEPVAAEPEAAVPDVAPEAEPEPVRASFREVPVLPDALLPRQRIIAFYGNPASTRMGILGELPPDEMLSLLDREVAAWREADPDTPVRPALQMIAVMATGDPGPDSLYRLRMPEWRIEEVAEWAARRNALLFLDIQPGQGDVEAEVDRLVPWLQRPDVHLALDPEWTMPDGVVPGTRIGSMTAGEVNYAIDLLARLVEEHDLPPKILVVHRFTQNMVRDAEDIHIDPRVQVVINMDGWGPPSQKRHAYHEIVAPEAEQFTGFKLFYKNDLRNDSRLMTPGEILRLDPTPSYIQYQ